MYGQQSGREPIHMIVRQRCSAAMTRPQIDTQDRIVLGDDRKAFIHQARAAAGDQRPPAQSPPCT